MSDQHDPLEERLRAALSASADDVTPRGDGLARIRERIEQKQGSSLWARLRTRWLANPAFAAASSVGVIALGLGTAIGVGQVSAGQAPFGIGGDDSRSPTSAVETSTSKSPDGRNGSDTKTRDSGTPDKTKKKNPPATVPVPVYHIVRTGNGSFGVSASSQQVTVKGSKRNRQEERAEGAFKAILDGGSAVARTGAGIWEPGTEVEDVDLEGSTLRVRFASPPSGADPTAEGARAALKQIVFTGLEAAPAATSVQILVGDAPVSSFWDLLAIDPGGMQRNDEAITRSFNVINSPDPGSTNLSPVTIAGNGAYDGGQVYWQLTRAGEVVKSGTASTGTSRFANWSQRVQVDPGEYELTTYEQVGGGRLHVRTVEFSVFE